MAQLVEQERNLQFDGDNVRNPVLSRRLERGGTHTRNPTAGQLGDQMRGLFGVLLAIRAPWAP